MAKLLLFLTLALAAGQDYDPVLAESCLEDAECALSLRQLRGKQSYANIADHWQSPDAEAESAATEEAEPTTADVKPTTADVIPMTPDAKPMMKPMTADLPAPTATTAKKDTEDPFSKPAEELDPGFSQPAATTVKPDESPATAEVTPAEGQAATGNWRLEKLFMGAELGEYPLAEKMKGRPVTASIREKDGKIQISMRIVNTLNFFATSKADTSLAPFDALTITGPGISTMMAGPESMMQTEGAVSRALPSVRKWLVKDGKLIISGPTMEMTFVRPSEEPATTEDPDSSPAEPAAEPLPEKTAPEPPAKPATLPAQVEEPPAKPATLPAPVEEPPAKPATLPAPVEEPAKPATLPAPVEEPAKPATLPAEEPEEAEEQEEEAEEEPTPAVNNTLQMEWEEKQGGLCCYSGDNPADTCGSCYPTAVASYKSPCASGKYKCMSCGGSWCQPKCVMGAADPKNKCKTAFPTGIADSKSTCGANAKTCAACEGEWCRTGVSSVPEAHKGPVSSSDASIATSTVQGFCCYRGNVFAKNMCGACEDVSMDIACANVAGCGKCGGTWCAGPRCVKAYKDKSNPCGSAYLTSVASAKDYCGGSESHCLDCAGAWCSADNITYISGEKFDPSKPIAAEEPEDEEVEEVVEVEPEEPVQVETIDDLFPNPLAPIP